MKRILSTGGWLAMAAALMGVTVTACSGSDDFAADGLQQPEVVKTYTLIVTASKGGANGDQGDGATTRALA